MQALEQLPDDLAVSVLRSNLEALHCTLNEQLAQLPKHSHVLAIRAAFPDVARSTEVEFSCIDFTAATSSTCLAYLISLPRLRRFTIKIVACSAPRKRGCCVLRHALHSALASAERNNTALSLQVLVCCPVSLRPLLRSAAHSSALRELELIDSRYTPFKTHALSRALSRDLRGLTSLQSLTLREFPFDSEAWSPSWGAVRRGIETLTQLTHLYLDRCIRAEVLTSFLRNLSRLRSLDACCAAKSLEEARALQHSVAGLSELTNLCLAESRWPLVRKLLFCRRWWPEAQDFSQAYHSELIHAAHSLKSCLLYTSDAADE